MSDTQERIRAWWREHGNWALKYSKQAWDELDAAIRADERALARPADGAPTDAVQWKVPCPVCDGRGELREAVQAWDIPGAPVPRCTHCDDGVATMILANPATNTATEEAEAK